MEENKIVKYEGGLIKRVSNAISVTNKLLALTEPQLIPYRKKDKWGYCTPDKKIVIDCIYDNAYLFSEGFAIVKIKERWSLIDRKGKNIIKDIELIRFPKLHDYMTEGRITEWHKKVGDSIYDGELLVELETDKAICDFQSSKKQGKILYIVERKEAKLAVNELLAIIGDIENNISEVIVNKISKEINVFKTAASFSDYSFSGGYEWKEIDGKLGYVSKGGIEYWED